MANTKAHFVRMMLRSVAKFLIPAHMRISLRRRVVALRRRIKSPTMDAGYRDSTGVWRANTKISDTVFMDHPENILIYDNVFIWHYTILDGTAGITIEEGCQIGAWVGIFTHSSHMAIRLYGAGYDAVSAEDKIAYQRAPVRLGKYTFVGAAAKILPGVTVGKGCIISTGAIVTKSVDDFQIVSGNPATVIGDSRHIDKRYLKDPSLKSLYDAWTSE